MNPMSKEKRRRIIAATFAAALLIILGGYSLMAHRALTQYRRAARYSAQEALEETVYAVEDMSRTLQKSAYATDAGMRARLCAQIYADALAAESALSTLPFSTQELEELSAYLNRMGDYALTLAGAEGDAGFDERDEKQLRQLSRLADSLSASLTALRTRYHNGEVVMDTAEASLPNIGTGTAESRVSRELLLLESEFPRRAAPEYDGKYAAKSAPDSPAAKKTLSDAEKLAVAAGFVGMSPAQLRLAHEYEGVDGRKCYTAGETLICVGPLGVESLGSSRRIGEAALTLEDAQARAYDFLEGRGYKSMTLISGEARGAAAHFKFARVYEGAVCRDNYITLAIALDNGDIYAFNAAEYSEAEYDVKWPLEEDAAAARLPESLHLIDIRRVIISSPGGEAIAAYELRAKAADGAEVTLYLDGENGAQLDILVTPAAPDDEADSTNAAPSSVAGETI